MAAKFSAQTASVRRNGAGATGSRELSRDSRVVDNQLICFFQQFGSSEKIPDANQSARRSNLIDDTNSEYSKMDSKKEHGQFYCEVCDCELKDSANFLDHINGKRHNRNKGIDLKQFKDSSLEEVKAMLQKKKRERDERQSNNDKESNMIQDVPGEHSEDEDSEDGEDGDGGDED